LRFSLLIKNDSKKVAPAPLFHLTLLDGARFITAPSGFKTPDPSVGETRFARLRNELHPGMWSGAFEFEVEPLAEATRFRVETIVRCSTCEPSGTRQVLVVNVLR